MPVGRNGDGVFGSVVRVCFKDAYRGYLPYALRHDPPGRRGHAFKDIRLDPFNANDLVMRLVLSFETWPHASGSPALQALGRYLKDIGSLPRTDFADYISQVCHQYIGQQVLHGERLLAKEWEAPDYWIKDMRRYLAAAREAVNEGNVVVPTDLPGSTEERQALLQELVYRYGELLTYWPVMVEAATELKEEGIRPAKEL